MINLSRRNVHWSTKLALLVLAFLPFTGLFIGLITKSILPSLPFLNLSGETQQYLLFVRYAPENILGSALSVAFCFILAMVWIMILAVERGAFRLVLDDLINAFTGDLETVFGVHSHKKAPDPPANENKQTANENKPAGETTSPTVYLANCARNRHKNSVSTQAPETTP